MARTQRNPTSGIRLSDFIAKKTAEPKPVYVLRGTDSYLLDQGRQVVRSQTISDADPGLAVVDVAGPEAVLADVLDALRTPSFLAARRLVIVREADSFLAPKGRTEDEQESGDRPAAARPLGNRATAQEKRADGGKVRDALLRYLEAPAPTGSLCLEVASWNENTRLAKRVVDIGCLVLCEADRPGVVPGWLTKKAKDLHQKTLTHAAAQMLVEYLGLDFASLLAALDMLALYTEAGTVIDTPQVDALIARGHHERVWALCDAVAEGQIPRALELLDAFWAEGMVAPQIVGLLRPTMRQLVRTKAFSRRMALDAALSKAGVPYPAQARVRRALAALSDDHLAAAYQALVDADLEAKTTPNDRLAMETMVHRLCLPQAARGTAGAAE